MNPAALSALVSGDYDNARIASTPGGIERQEAQGQQWLCESGNILPLNLINDTKEYLESKGFVFGQQIDEVFQNVQFPQGWTIQPGEDTPYGSFLVNPDGKREVDIFYKAAFYDRRARAYKIKTDAALE